MADETSNRTPRPEDAAEGEWPGKHGPGETSGQPGNSSAESDEDASGSGSNEEKGSKDQNADE